MGAMQEKASDKKSELDVLRAKRAMEQYEREWRQKERAAIEKQKMQHKILHEARVQQKKEKERCLETVVKSERAEFDRIVQVQREAEAVEVEKESQMMGARYKHRKDVQEQITKNETKRRQERLDYLEEGRKLRKEIEKEKGHLQDIKDRKIHEMRGAGVPEKYLTELIFHRFTTRLGLRQRRCRRAGTHPAAPPATSLAYAKGGSGSIKGSEEPTGLVLRALRLRELRVHHVRDGGVTRDVLL